MAPPNNILMPRQKQRNYQPGDCSLGRLLQWRESDPIVSRTVADPVFPQYRYRMTSREVVTEVLHAEWDSGAIIIKYIKVYERGISCISYTIQRGHRHEFY